MSTPVYSGEVTTVNERGEPENHHVELVDGDHDVFGFPGVSSLQQVVQDVQRPRYPSVVKA